jgi:putative transposase
MAQRNNLAGIVAGVSTPEEEILGVHFWALGYLAVSCGTITDEMIQEYIEEQEGEQIADDGRFPIDNR